MRIGVGLSIPELATRGGRFSPASLFTSGVAGAWYDPSDVLLNWRTNLLTWTQEFDNAAWTKNAATVTANTVAAPDGTTTADKLIPSTAASQHFVSSPDIAAGTYTWSAYFKSAGYTKAAISCYDGISYKAATLFDLSTGTVVSSVAGSVSTITDSGNGWYRCTVTATLAAASSFGGGQFRPNIGGSVVTEAVAGNGTDGIYIWGAQLELGSTATAYQAITTPEQTYLTYDPQPVLYQDSAGTTPVTAVEQPVGLMLDKSQGLATSAELVPDYDFATPASWTPETADWVVSGGKATYTKPGAGVQYLQSNDNISIVSGTWYKLTVVISGIASGNAIFGLHNKTASVNYLGAYQTISANGTYSFYFLATSSTTGIRIYGNAGGTATSWSFESFGIKSIAGNHASQATAASRPVLRARYNLLTYSEQFDNAVWTKAQTTISANAVTAPDGTTTADKMVETAVTNVHGAYQTFTYVSGATYSASVYAKQAERSWIYLGADTSAAESVFFDLANGTVGAQGTGYVGSIQSVGDGWYRCTVTITQSTALPPNYFVVGVTTANNTTSYLGDITKGVYLWGADLRTGSSAGTYQRIAAATDYATAGFLPYLYFVTDDSFGTNSIDFTATDKMSVCAGVTKLGTAPSIFAELSALSASNNGSFYVGANTAASNDYTVQLQGTSNCYYSATTYAAPITNVVSAQFDIAGAGIATEIIPRVNTATPTLTASGTTAGTGNFGNYPLFIGRRNNASLPFEGRIYQLIVCGKTLSASELASTEAYVNSKTGAY